MNCFLRERHFSVVKTMPHCRMLGLRMSCGSRRVRDGKVCITYPTSVEFYLTLCLNYLEGKKLSQLAWCMRMPGNFRDIWA